MNILCQICGSLIATANKDDLQIPLHGSMLQSPYPDRMPESLFPDTEWEFLKCPVCLHRPFITNDIVLTDEGVYRIPEKEEIPEAEEVRAEAICPKCGKAFKNERALATHLRFLGTTRKKKE